MDNDNQPSEKNNEAVLIKISEINTNIPYLWKIQAIISYEYTKRTFINIHGSGEISSWDLSDESGSITLIAFNLNSHLLSNKLKKDKMYEFMNLSVRIASDVYKTLPHEFQILCNNATCIEEIGLPLLDKDFYDNLVHLSQVNILPLNSIIDIEVHVVRDFGISTGEHNNKLWFRRDLHVTQDETQIRMTLWNDQAQSINRNMAGLSVKFKHIKISWFNGVRNLVTIANTQLKII